MANPTLRELVGMDNSPAAVNASALVLIDCQNTYCEGVMRLDGVEAALEQCRTLLERYRASGRPVVHVQHDAGPGSPYDVRGHSGAIAEIVAPREGEPGIVKALPSSFENTSLDDLLKEAGVTDLVLTGFMTHVCINSTARAAFNRGYHPTVVASATATRALPGPDGVIIPSNVVHAAALAALGDIFAVVVPTADDIPA